MAEISSCQFPSISSLMEKGEPVCITLANSEGEASALLFCELVHRARMGGSCQIESQRCRPGAYILGLSEVSPADYYLKSGRYKDPDTADRAVSSLPRIDVEFRSMKIEPLSRNNDKFDVLFLYLKPERAMRIIQAYAYYFGKGIASTSIGAASICGDCTARPLKEGIGLSYGCKGSRKHSFYADEEIPLGISYEMIEVIEEGLKNTPETFD